MLKLVIVYILLLPVFCTEEVSFVHMQLKGTLEESKVNIFSNFCNT